MAKQEISNQANQVNQRPVQQPQRVPSPAPAQQPQQPVKRVIPVTESEKQIEEMCAVNSVTVESKQEAKSESTQPTSDQFRKRDPVMSLAEVARRIGKSTQTISRWAKEGLLPIIRLPSGLPGVPQSSFERVFTHLKTVQEEKKNGK